MGEGVLRRDAGAGVQHAVARGGPACRIDRGGSARADRADLADLARDAERQAFQDSFRTLALAATNADDQRESPAATGDADARQPRRLADGFEQVVLGITDAFGCGHAGKSLAQSRMGRSR